MSSLTPWVPIGSPLAKVGIEADRLHLCCSQHGNHDQSGQRRCLDVSRRQQRLGKRSALQMQTLIRKKDISAISRRTTPSGPSTPAYGGNVLLGKKCFALRIASYQGKKEGWMAEHMLILGIENPQGEVKYIAAAFPSACGKTNLAMLIPPEIYQKTRLQGLDCRRRYRLDAHRSRRQTLYAINPENGFFGVAPGTNEKSNPNALASTKKDTIFTNVAHNLDDNTVWWEGLDKNPPKNAIDWKGKHVGRHQVRQADKTLCAHPNSRFTAPAKNCPCISAEFDNRAGRADFRNHLRRPPCKDRSAGLPVQRLGARRIRRLHHGFRDHRCRCWRCWRCPS